MSSAEKAKRIIDRYEADGSALIQVLSEIQEALGYLPRDVLDSVSKELRVPLSKIYGVVTFYSFFRMTPPAEIPIQVCQGTACHVLGAANNAAHMKRRLGIDFGEQTEDGMFSLESVACIGACGLAPCMVVDGKVHAKQTTRTIDQLLKKLRVKK